ncbi:Ldh family oxidoreductase [Saccharopolyspora flava]|uniref:Malate/lactate/ureidoglycolate dehydrogenase, LDH2 family n=1 Tax=Saccharopolyspora flava TaxID=95161 RepID=A0A1I6P951_9PSEU|nr:Ldh family oxidoreductase [Saccharopolyspora flava]SFS36696.1 Malate/lactate/ureidoglycolate dehydrogenase, LDH2 family [Saccharopolyspora flava]
MRVSVDAVRELIGQVFIAWGMDHDLAAVTAEVMAETDLAGIDSHGVSMLMSYERMRAEGLIDLTARPAVVRENAASALVDAGGGIGHPAGELAMRTAIDKAKAGTVGVVSVVNSHHFGAAGHYAEMAARQKLIGLVTSSANLPAAPPTGSVVPMLATNPIAFAAPARRNPHFLLDIATTTAAVNKVKVYDFHDEPLPEGWVVDDVNRPVTDAREALGILRGDGAGGLTPLGGTPEMGSHKGYGLSMMAHLLGATLCGGTFPAIRKPGEPNNIGHFFLALDPSGFRPPGEFEDDLDDAVDLLHAAPPLNADEPVLVAGDPQAAARQDRSRNGIPLPDVLVEQLRGIAERAGVPSGL